MTARPNGSVLFTAVRLVRAPWATMPIYHGLQCGQSAQGENG